MTVAAGGPSSSGLADVIDTILDKGMVIDAYVRVSLVGIEILAIDARVVVASVDTYLRFAEAIDRLGDNPGHPEPRSLGDNVGDLVSGPTKGVASGKSQGALEGAGKALKGFVDELKDEQPARRRRD